MKEQAFPKTRVSTCAWLWRCLCCCCFSRAPKAESNHTELRDVKTEAVRRSSKSSGKYKKQEPTDPQPAIAIQKSFDLFQSYDLLPDAIIFASIDHSGNKHQVIFINNAAATLTGYQKEEVIGNKVNLFMPVHIASAHDTYVANWIMTKRENGKEDSKSESSGHLKTDVAPAMIRPLAEFDMTRGAIRAVPLRTKSGEEIPVSVRLHIFARGRKLYAIAVIRPQHLPIPFITSLTA